MKNCDLCGREVKIYHRFYKKKGYCGTCYAYLFKKRECSICGKLKRINKYDRTPICKGCENKGKPCVRCGKKDFKIGKIIELGPVCNSCAAYFRPRQICSICNVAKPNASRCPTFNINEPMCDKCFNKLHGIKCSRCRNTTKPYLFTLNKEPVCKLCATKPDKNCKHCGKQRPAGKSGSICADCAAKVRLRKRLNLSKSALSKTVAEIYMEYGLWMEETRAPDIAARKIISSFEIFKFLSDWHEMYGGLPTYDEYATNLTVAKTRQHLTVTYFLDQAGYIPLDHERKLEIGSLDCIERAFNRIPAKHAFHSYMESYHRIILSKYEQGNNTAHTARLSFGTAVSLLELGIELSKETIEIELVRQYLWLHAGQRSSLWGYINHLRKHHNLELPSLEDKQTYDLKLQRPKESIERCKQKLISFLRAKTFSRDDYLELALAYYHRVKLPDELVPLRAHLGQHKGDWVEVKLSKDKFLIPKLTVVRKLLTTS